VCLVTFQDADVGSCIELCSSDSRLRARQVHLNPYGGTPFCADSCDPLFPECPQGRSCLQAEDRFICAIAFEDVDIGVTGEECSAQSYSGCAEGYACMTGALIPGCNFSACCTNVCDLDDRRLAVRRALAVQEPVPRARPRLRGPRRLLRAHLTPPPLV
jgi:hypothetical protein